MNSSLSLRSVVLALTLVVCVVPQVAAADTSTVKAASTTVHVPYTDLNLSNQAGLDTLYTRLSSAARSVCGNQSDLKIVGSLKQLRINNECYANTLAKALAEVNFPHAAQAMAG